MEGYGDTTFGCMSKEPGQIDMSVHQRGAVQIRTFARPLRDSFVRNRMSVEDSDWLADAASFEMDVPI